MQNTHIVSPLVLPTLANPYPYYKDLLLGALLPFDTHSNCWIASRAQVVQEVFESAHCVVRPVSELVPKNIVGSAAGDVFAHLVRMNEGEAHLPAKRVLQASLRSVDFSSVGSDATFFAEQLATIHAINTGSSLSSWMFELPVHVVGKTLGFSAEELPDLAVWMADFVRCLSPLSNTQQLADASLAAHKLQVRFREMLQLSLANKESFLARLQAEAKLVGWENADAITANIIGLLSQTSEASAGLIGNSLVVLQQQPALLAQIQNSPSRMNAFVEEVARYDSPVQNTRRFVREECTIAGQDLQGGDVILLLLAAANRDANLNPDPDTFTLHRVARKLFTFGHGHHTCPGHEIALNIAAQAIQSLLDFFEVEHWQSLRWTYRASLNGRIPVFTHTKE